MSSPRRLPYVALAIASALLVPIAPSAAATVCEAPVEIANVGLACPRADGLFEVVGRDGRSLGFTHGYDAAPAPDVAAAPPSVDPVCVPAGTAYSMRVVYARASNVPDRYATMAPQIRDMVKQANGYVVASANSATGGSLPVKLRVQCSGSTIVVDNQALPTALSSRSFGTVVDDLTARGYTNGQMKYWVWHDDGSSAPFGCGGVGHIYNDDRPGAENWNNGNGGALFAVTFACTGLSGGEVMLHENSHNMGAVQKSAPQSTDPAGSHGNGWHCWDGLDIMCYNDGAPRGSWYTTGVCSTKVYDCGNNDYFHPSPAAGSYLATKWNVAGAANRFVVRGGCALAASGELIVGTPPGYDGVGIFNYNLARAPIPSACWEKPFVLTGASAGYVTSTPSSAQDFDVCMESDTARLACWGTAGGDEGTIPTGTTRASIWYYTGTWGRWTLTAS